MKVRFTRTPAGEPIVWPPEYDVGQVAELAGRHNGTAGRLLAVHTFTRSGRAVHLAAIGSFGPPDHATRSAWELAAVLLIHPDLTHAGDDLAESVTHKAR